MKPTFLIVGAAKAGTSSIWAYLSRHPSVFMSANKEPNYYIENLGIKSEQEYEQLFSEATPSQQVGEASTSYLYVPSVAGRIAADLGTEVPIVVMLRDPIQTAYSMWAYNTSIGREWLSFREALSVEQQRLDGRDSRASRVLPNITTTAYTGRVKYTEQLERYIGLFDHIHIAFFEEFFADPEEGYGLLCDFLSVSRHQPNFEVINRGGMPRSRIARSVLAASSPARIHWWSPMVRRTLPKSWRAQGRSTQARIRSRLLAAIPEMDESEAELVRSAVSGDVARLESLLGRPVPKQWHEYSIPTDRNDQL